MDNFSINICHLWTTFASASFHIYYNLCDDSLLPPPNTTGDAEQLPWIAAIFWISNANTSLHQGRYSMAGTKISNPLQRAGSLLPSPISSFWTLKIPLGNTKSVYNTNLFSWVLGAFGQRCLFLREIELECFDDTNFLSVSKSVFYKRLIPTLKWCKHLKIL